MYNIKDKLLVRGVESLSNLELLALMLDDTSEDQVVARTLLESCSDDLNLLFSSDIAALRMIDGVGVKRAAAIIASFELSRRAIDGEFQQMELTCSADVANLFRRKISGMRHEECWAVHLNSANRVVEVQRVSQGGVDFTAVDNRLIVKRSLELLTTKLLLVHNHPSGSVEPSQEDIELTLGLRSAAALFGIKLLDHIILSSEMEYSFASGGLLQGI